MPVCCRITLLLALALPPPVLAQALPDTTSAPAAACIPPGDIPPRQPVALRSGEAIEILAQEIVTDRLGASRLSGNVHLRRGDQRVEAEELHYDPAAGLIDIPGNLTYNDGVIRILAGRAWYRINEESGRFEDVRYHIAGAEGTGHAAVVESAQPGRTRLTQFDFTTCDPDDPDWQLKAARVDINHERGTATARNARLEFKGVPVLYSPWLSFPVDNQRKSGFLFPRFGATSDDGLDLSVPWYWNIAPNQDATFTPRWIQRRGGWLGSEYRFLTPRQRGQLNTEYLPNDRRADRDRYYVRADYRVRLADNWSGMVDFRRASDERYFTDLGSDLEQSAVQFLRSVGQVRGRGRYWNAHLLADSFQILDETVAAGREPYRRLPRMALQGDWPLGAGFEFTLDSEAVYFDRSEGVTGGRLDLLPRLRWNLLRPGWFVQPAVAFRSTAYQLDDDGSRSETRNLPILSFDSGLIFERRTRAQRIQTLEPRLFYLYTPYREQSDLPRFDTSELTFGFSQLFHDNRFSGPDRQADANQLALAVTSRLLDPGTGLSRLELSLGQIIYFRDLKVQIDDQPTDTRNQSAYVGEVTLRTGPRLALTAAAQWDPEENELQVGAFGLTYRGRDHRQIALGYRYRRDRVDQADLRARWPLTVNTRLIGRANYSFLESEPLELLGGIEYESCCWALQLTARQWVKDRESDSRTAVFLELHLKGLGSLGRRPYDLFAETH